MDDDSIPLADDDPQGKRGRQSQKQDYVRVTTICMHFLIIFAAIINDDDTDNNNARPGRGQTLPQGKSMDSLPSTFTNGSSSPGPSSHGDQEIQPDEQEEKARLISQVLELQNTLDDLSQRVNSVKEENLKLKSENSVLNQYIENLMSASSVISAVSKAK